METGGSGVRGPGRPYKCTEHGCSGEFHVGPGVGGVGAVPEAASCLVLGTWEQHQLQTIRHRQHCLGVRRFYRERVGSILPLLLLQQLLQHEAPPFSEAPPFPRSSAFSRSPAFPWKPRLSPEAPPSPKAPSFPRSSAFPHRGAGG